MRLSEIDWLGYGMLAVGLAALIVFMKQGDRFFWLDNPAIQHLGLLAAVAIPLALILLLLRRRPLLDLGLMATPTFGWAVATATRLQGFRIPEIAEANIWMFRSQCVGFPLAWFWASRGDARQPLSLLLFAAGALVCTYLTPQWQAGDFRLALILVGVGQDLFLVPTLFYATRDVKPEQGPTGIVANRKTRIGEYVAAGTRMLSIVPINDLWVEANYRETQVGRMKVGDPVRIDVDTYPDRPICGYVEAILPVAGSEFALIPPDNATGNFTKIVRRFTVRIRFSCRRYSARL